MTLVTRLVRAEMLEVLRTDYIKFARARGLLGPRHQFRPCAEEHAGAGDHRSSACSSAPIIAFAIITETVFQWPGMGLMFIQAVQNADIPVMAAYLLLVAFLFVLINFIVDLLYVRVDPRIRIFGRRRDRCDRHRDAGLRRSCRRNARRRCGQARSPRALDSDLLHSFPRSRLVVCCRGPDDLHAVGARVPGAR